MTALIGRPPRAEAGGQGGWPPRHGGPGWRSSRRRTRRARASSGARRCRRRRGVAVVPALAVAVGFDQGREAGEGCLVVPRVQAVLVGRLGDGDRGLPASAGDELAGEGGVVGIEPSAQARVRGAAHGSSMGGRAPGPVSSSRALPRGGGRGVWRSPAAPTGQTYRLPAGGRSEPSTGGDHAPSARARTLAMVGRTPPDGSPCRDRTTVRSTRGPRLSRTGTEPRS
jgi:hypothetical protein